MSDRLPETRIPGNAEPVIPDTASAAGPPAPHASQLGERGPLLDQPLYERLIGDGIATADARHTTIDHVTARRLAIWLTAQHQPPGLAHGLADFIRTGAISRVFKTQLRNNARSASYPNQPQAARLMQYCLSRTDPGPIGENFGGACDQIDRADVMLADLRDRLQQGHTVARPEAGRARIVALAGRNPGSQTVSLILDENTANIAIFAVAAQAGEREAHVREVQRFGQSLPEGSYGWHNRQAIAAREAQLATRLRAVERAYRAALDAEAAPEPSEPTTTFRSPEQAADREIELE